MDDRGRVMEVLGKSRLFMEYATAFHEATGVNLCLEGVPPADTPQDRKPDATADRLLAQPQLAAVRNGVYCGIIPICDGAHLMALIRTGPILECPSPAEKRQRLTPMPVISRKAFVPLLKLLSIFAEQLGSLANQLVLRQDHCEPGIVLRAKQYIQANHREHLELAEVARHAHVSSYYLCKVFKKSTGINFSNYIARVRVEAAKELLNKQTFRINEIALEVGFQSLTHFNRVFKRFIGESPRAYRRRVLNSDTAGKVASFAKNNQLQTNCREAARVF